MTREFDSLSNRLASASDEARGRRPRKPPDTLAAEQARIREEAARLPASTRETAEAMRRALQDQFKALDQLSQISNRTAAMRDVMPPETSPHRSPCRPSARIASRTRRLPPVETSRGRQRNRDEGRADPRPKAAKAGRSAICWRAPPRQEDEQARERSAAPFQLDVGLISRAIDAATASAIWNRFRCRPAQHHGALDLHA